MILFIVDLADNTVLLLILTLMQDEMPDILNGVIKLMIRVLFSMEFNRRYEHCHIAAVSALTTRGSPSSPLYSTPR